MAANKVILNGETLIDLTEDDVTASDVAQGVKFHLPSGEQGVGTYSLPTQEKTVSITQNGETVIEPDEGYALSKVTANVSVASTNYFAEYVEGDLTEITADMLEGATQIGNYAFYHNKTVKSIEFPDSVLSIGQNAFQESTLESLSLGNGVTTIGRYSFANSKTVKSMTWGNGITTVERDCFTNMINLKNIYIPSLQKFAETRFSDHNIWLNINNLNVYFGNELFNKEQALVIPDGTSKIGSYVFTGFKAVGVTIPDSVTAIEAYAFQNSGTDLSGTLTIGNGVSSIGRSAFESCGFTSVIIGTGVTTIDSDAFRFCSSLTGVYISDLAAWCGISFSHYYSNPLNTAHNLYLNGELVTDLIIPNGVTRIGQYVFYNCTSITSVTISDSVTSFSNAAFDGCDGLTSVVIGNGLISIPYEMFDGYSNLTSVTIGTGVTEISSKALRVGSSTNKATITMLRTTPPSIQSTTFDESYLNQIIVPAGCGDTYKSATNWSKFADYIVEATE